MISEEFITEAFFGMVFMAVFLGVLAIGGFIADYILPRIPFLKRYFDSLQGLDDEDDKEV